MQIQTKYFGEIMVDQNNTITFSNGLPGFQDEKEFILIDLPNNPIFQVLQSIKQEDIAFIVTNPYHFYQDYEIELDDTILEQLAISSEEQVMVLSILTLNEQFEKSTINLQAPIIINQDKKLAKQYVTNDSRYLTRAPLKPVMEQGV
ncbi:flagellar assembly protein FliW [Amphibacillus sediminis]|uniref:flagellar assembly protein FliW n=1 Tax=Amphibacillus sediminis TaxID=360185 RepID=UPI000836AB4D|nr:flagellar assembly protein FliW [Amphibacillus sediminis]